MLNEERRAFIEAALAGVPAGVVGVDGEGVVGVCNAAAERLFGAEPGSAKGRRVAEMFPALGADPGRGAGSAARASGAGDAAASAGANGCSTSA